MTTPSPAVTDIARLLVDDHQRSLRQQAERVRVRRLTRRRTRD